jgi:hypothetical protein
VSAIDEFLIRFIVSLVNGGMTMRNPIGSSTYWYTCVVVSPNRHPGIALAARQ